MGMGEKQKQNQQQQVIINSSSSGSHKLARVLKDRLSMRSSK
jgi:hypothetical protein